MNAALSPVSVGVALRAIIDVADESLDVGVSEERLLVSAVSGVKAVLDEACTVWLNPAVPGDLPAVASSHSDAVQADLEGTVDLSSVPPATRRYTAAEPSGAWLAAHGLGQCVIAVVLIRGQAIGTLVTTRSDRRDPFDDVELRFISAMADIIGIAVQSIRVRNDAMVTVEELRQQTELTDNISDAVIACDEAHLIVGWNSGAEKIYGYSREEAVGCDLFTLLATEFLDGDGDGEPVDREHVFRELATTRQWRGELRERRADGASLVTLSSFTQMVDRRQHPTGLVAVSRDVTTQRREEYQAMHDVLTGLPNRRMLNSRLYEAVARAGRYDQPVAVVFIDLDGFKPINDTYGHSVGDKVLSTVAKRLSTAVRSRDTVGRLGGDEFLVILEEAGHYADIARTVDRISVALAEPIPVDGYPLTVLPSVGVCISAQPAKDPIPAECLLDLADQAMYTAKRERRGCVFVTAS